MREADYYRVAVLIFVSCVAYSGGLLHFSQHDVMDYKGSSTENTEKQSAVHDTQTALSTSNKSPPGNMSSPKSTPENYDKRNYQISIKDLLAQIVMAVGTIGILVLTFFGLMYIRARVGPNVIGFHIHIKNIGESTAFNVRYGGSVNFVDLAEADKRGPISRTLRRNNIVEPGACLHAMRSSANLIWLKEEWAKKAERIRLTERPYLMISGAIVWQDIFRTWRGVRFGYMTKYQEYGPINATDLSLAGNEVLTSEQVKMLTHSIFISPEVFERTYNNEHESH